MHTKSEDSGRESGISDRGRVAEACRPWIADRSVWGHVLVADVMEGVYKADVIDDA